MIDLSEDQRDRAVGVLLGAAAGDALGAGYEFTHPVPEQQIAMIGGGIGDFEPGEWTDDTAMTVAIAEVTALGLDLRAAAGLDAVAAGFLRWFDTNPKDVGIQTRTILAAHPSGGSAMTRVAAGLPGLTGGNGSLMRTAPVALAYLDDPAARADAALAVSRLTHADVRAGEACQIWCHLIADAVITGEIDHAWTFLGGLGDDAEHFWRPLKDLAETGGPADFGNNGWVVHALIADAVITGEIDHAWTFLGGLGDDAEHFWRPLKDLAETGGPADFGNNGWVVHALQTAWWAITHAGVDQPDLPRGLELAVRAGHDTDTTACIAGALLGACQGGSSVPIEWRDMLHGWPGLDADDLERLALRTVSADR